MKVRCKIGLHKWRKGIGWSQRYYSNAQRYDVCLCCDKNRWVDDQEGYDKLMGEVKYMSSTAGVRERRLGKLLDKMEKVEDI